MNHQKLLKLSIISMLVALPIAACSIVQSQEPKPGLWSVSESTYDAAYISFSVSDDGTTIRSFSIIPAGLPCGDNLRIGQVQFTADENSSIEVSDINSWMLSGEITTIDDNSFSVELQMYILPFDNIFDLQSGQLTFAGSFSSSSKASGTWEVDLLDSGGSCNGTWNAEPSETNN